MSLQRFSLYFLTMSACAVVLFPGMVPPAPAPIPQYPSSQSPDSFIGAAPYPAMMGHLMASRKFQYHHHHLHLAPATIVASN